MRVHSRSPGLGRIVSESASPVTRILDAPLEPLSALDQGIQKTRSPFDRLIVEGVQKLAASR
jgi:hypothetical protein